MKKLAKPFISIFITIVMIITVLPMSALAAYSSNYGAYNAPTRTLQNGCQGDDVRWLQCAINYLFYNGDSHHSTLSRDCELVVDGKYGPNTEKAVKEFQGKYGLTKDGIFGTNSRNKMKELLYAVEKPTPTPTPTPSDNNTSNTPSYPPADESVIKEGVYYIHNRLTNKYLDVKGGSSYDNAPIVQYPFHGGLNQQFLIKYEKGFYKIYTMAGGNRCLDLWSPSEANTNGTSLKIYEAKDSCPQQNFRIEKSVYGSYEIGSVTSYGNKVLEVMNSSYADCAVVQIWDRSASRDNDNWYIEPVDSYTVSSPNQFNRSSSEYPLGSVNYLGSRYRIVTRDEVPTAGMTLFCSTKKNKINFSLATAVANFDIQGGTKHATGNLGIATLCGVADAIGSATTSAYIRLNLYESTSSNLKFATIEVYDSELQDRLDKDSGYIKNLTNREGRSEIMYLSKEHTKHQPQYDGYFDSNGEFCIAFHTYSEDYGALRDSEDWSWNPTYTNYSRFSYGDGNRYQSLFAPLKASGDSLNLLKQCIGY